MKHYKRRKTNGFPYFKVATFDARSFCYRDGNRAFDSEQAARDSQSKAGKYRVSRVDINGRTDLAEFVVS